MTGLDRTTLEAIRAALRQEESGEIAVLDRLLAAGTTDSLTPAEALRVFAMLIGIEWRRGKWAQYNGVTIHALVTAWRAQAAVIEEER